MWHFMPPQSTSSMRTAMTHRQHAVLYSVIVACVSTVTLVEWLTPLVLDFWVLYLPIVLVPVWFNDSRPIVITAIACTVLMGADAFFPHRNTARAFVLGNLS